MLTYLMTLTLHLTRGMTLLRFSFLGSIHLENKEVAITTQDLMGFMVGDISFPLIFGSRQMEGIKYASPTGLGFFKFSLSQLKILNMLWILGVHPLSKFTLIPSSLSDKKFVDHLVLGGGPSVECYDQVEGVRDTFLEYAKS
jgi:hypothetical protein